MYYRTPRRHTFKVLLSILIIMGLFGSMSLSVVGGIPDNPKSFITSRFILWDNEKMMDNEFVIHILSDNYSYYEVHIDTIIYNNTFFDYTNLTIIENEKDFINNLKVMVNNETILDVNNIAIISGLESNNINRGVSPFVISLNPYEWNQKEWGIFWSIMTASLLSIFISYRMIIRYRKVKGVREIK